MMEKKMKGKILELESEIKRQIAVLKPDPSEPGWSLAKVQSVYTVLLFVYLRFLGLTN
jgi:hypothetical protein